MQTTATLPALHRDEIEVSLHNKYGLALNARAATSSATLSTLSHGADQRSSNTARDEIERLLSVKYGVGLVRKPAVVARDEIVSLLGAKYGLALKQQ
jgi:hypothetical protein